MTARIVPTAAGVTKAADAWRDAGETVGLVPTMGALHEGHASLMRRAHVECDRVIVSDFVNPLQFVAGEDFERYPRDLEHDAAIAGAEHVDILFAPEVDDVYPDGYPPPVTLDPGPLGDRYEGAARPGHFAGMLTVVDRMLDIVGDCRAYFGQKDAQQLFLVKQMAAERHPAATVVACDIVREPGGLAMSSRNVYLDPDQHRAAEVLSRALVGAAALVTTGERDPQKLTAFVENLVATEPAVALDEFAIVDDETFEPAPAVLQLAHTYRGLIAANVGPTRLIDNLALHVGHGRRVGRGRYR